MSTATATSEELMTKSLLGSAHGRDVDLEQMQQEEKQGTLGTFLGVAIPCVMSIFGVILFLRLGWVVGQAGFWQCMAIILVASSVAFLTILSVSAISTNGQVKGGGLYFMISRALGCEFGGSIGFIFYAANIAGGALYMIGFAEAIRNTANLKLFGSDYLTQLVLSSGVLLLLLFIALGGAAIFAKATFFIFILLAVSIAGGAVSLLAMSSGKTSGFTGPSWSTWQGNMASAYQPTDGSDNNVFTVFAVFFPAVTGIMAGANMSGDLRNPARAIPMGTISSFLIAVVIYIALATFFAASVVRETLINNTLVMQDVTFWPPLITTGICCSTLSSALASIVGSARVMQAIGRDRILPGLFVMAKGSGSSDEPKRCVILSWFLIQALLLIGKLNTLARLTSMFFLLSYAVVNLACFVLKISGTPNFRPAFTFYGWQTALAGAILSAVTMFVCDPIYATIAFAVLVLTFLAIHYVAPAHTWGDISQALMYHQVRKYLLLLDSRKDHVKYWRPQLLLLVDEPRRAMNLIDFANNVKKGGLYVLGNVIVGDLQTAGQHLREQQNAFLEFIASTKIKAFSEVLISPNYALGAQHLITAAGLGAMKPNTVMMGFFRGRDGPQDTDTRNLFTPFQSVVKGPNRFTRKDNHQYVSKEEYLSVVRDAMYFGKNVIIARHFSRLNKSLIVGFHKYKEKSTEGQRVQKMMTIDVWLSIKCHHWDPFGPTELLQLQFAHIVSQTSIWKKHTSLRIMTVVNTTEEAVAETKLIQRTLETARIRASVNVVVLETEDLPSLFGEGVDPASMVSVMNQMSRLELRQVQNALIRKHSEHTGVLFLGLPKLPESEDDYVAYADELEALTAVLPPTVLTSGHQEVVNTSM